MTPNTKTLLVYGVDDALRSLVRLAGRLRDHDELDLAELAYANGELDRLRRIVDRENAKAPPPAPKSGARKRPVLRVVNGGR